VHTRNDVSEIAESDQDQFVIGYTPVAGDLAILLRTPAAIVRGEGSH
jgi:hypothetical protein